MKTCSKCGKEKSFNEWYSKQSRLCKSCDRKYHREYHHKNKVTENTRKARWRNTCKGKYTAYKKKAKARNIDFNLSLEDFEKFWQNPCYYCGEDIETVGVDRVDNLVEYELCNCVACCTKCNYAKHATTINIAKKIISFQEERCVEIFNRWRL